MKGDEWRLGPRAQRMNRSRQFAFAGAAFAGEEHRRLGWSHLAGDAIDLLHRRARPEETLEALAGVVAGLPPEVLRLDPQIAAFERALDAERHRVEVDGLGQIVCGTRTHRG